MVLESGAGVLLVLCAFPGHEAGRAVDPRVIDVAELPLDLAGGCLHAQPLAADAAMRFSRLFKWFHAVPPVRRAAVRPGCFMTRQCCDDSI